MASNRNDNPDGDAVFNNSSCVQPLDRIWIHKNKAHAAPIKDGVEYLRSDLHKQYAEALQEQVDYWYEQCQYWRNNR